MSAADVTVRVPFLDLACADGEPRAAMLEAIRDLLDSCAFTNGPQVPVFEREYARYCGADLCVGVSSGTDALRLILLAAGLAPGDEVVVPAMTFVATLEAVVQAGGTPVVADVRDDDYGLDPAAATAAVTSRTRFILPVHLFGQLADLRGLLSVSRRDGLALVEDACQAHGARRDGLQAGTAGLAGAFSFYPGKNLGAIGDAGAIVTDDESVAARARALREHGQYRKYEHAHEGYTARLDTVQAIALLHRLPLLDRRNAERRAAAHFYTRALAGIGDLRLPEVAPGSEHAWHLYVVRTGDPDRLAEYLAGRGIGSGRHYPQPPHLAPAFARLGYSPGAFPVAERLAKEALSLPLFPGITEGQLEAVVAGIAGYFHGG